MLKEQPLTLTLAPFAGAREKQRLRNGISSDAGFAHRLRRILPLPFRKGEGRGEDFVPFKS